MSNKKNGNFPVGLTDGSSQRVVLHKWAKPFYSPGDEKNSEDEAYHEHLNKVFEDRLRIVEDKIHQQRWGEERTPGKSFLALESDESDQPRKKRKKIISSSEYITKKQENQRKKKLLESLDPQEYLTLQSLVIIIFNNLTKCPL